MIKQDKLLSELTAQQQEILKNQALQREQEKHMQEFVKISITTNKEFEANVIKAIESSAVLKSLLPDIKVM